MLLQSVPINMEIKWRFLYRLCSTRNCHESMDRASWTVCINTVERRTGRYTKYIFSFLGYYWKLFRNNNFSCTSDKTINIEITGIGNSKMWSIMFEPLKSWFPLKKQKTKFFQCPLSVIQNQNMFMFIGTPCSIPQIGNAVIRLI